MGPKDVSFKRLIDDISIDTSFYLRHNVQIFKLLAKTYSTFSPAKSKTLVIFILLGSDDSSSFSSSSFSATLDCSDFLSGIESKMELTILRGCVDCCCVDLPEALEACFLGAEDDIDVRLPSPPDFGFGLVLAAVSFLKSAHRSSTLLFSSAAF